tara:strand:- start:202 stop:408 length:207 start_codon:yes stop_codon:yes gene_type:complete
MQPGDLVDHIFKDWNLVTGIVIAVELWKDPGAPDRNYGCSVDVMWPCGSIDRYEEDELRYAGEISPRC